MRVAFLGLGAMGSRMAHNLMLAGYELIVWNRSRGACDVFEEAGCLVADNPAETARGSDVVISMVRDNLASREVWLDADYGALAAMKDGAVGVESSTCTVSWIRELGALFEERDPGFIDAPVVGSRLQAEKKELIYLAGGDGDYLKKVEPVLLCMGSAVHHCGEIGNGAALKLIVNALLGAQVALMGELLPVIEGLGLDKKEITGILNQAPPFSKAAYAAMLLMIENNHAPAFPVGLMDKDLSYLTYSWADKRDLPVCETVLNVFQKAIEAGFAEDNMTSVVRLYDS